MSAARERRAQHLARLATKFRDAGLARPAVVLLEQRGDVFFTLCTTGATMCDGGSLASCRMYYRDRFRLL